MTPDHGCWTPDLVAQVDAWARVVAERFLEADGDGWARLEEAAREREVAEFASIVAVEAWTEPGMRSQIGGLVNEIERRSSRPLGQLDIREIYGEGVQIAISALQTHLDAAASAARRPGARRTGTLGSTLASTRRRGGPNG
ncbi:MAG: hypothetical protein AB7I38_16780 [Dehalococcoidia bacterium]